MPHKASTSPVASSQVSPLGRLPIDNDQECLVAWQGSAPAALSCLLYAAHDLLGAFLRCLGNARAPTPPCRVFGRRIQFYSSIYEGMREFRASWRRYPHETLDGVRAGQSIEWIP